MVRLCTASWAWSRQRCWLSCSTALAMAGSRLSALQFSAALRLSAYLDPMFVAGYFSAPAAQHCPLGRISAPLLLPSVTLVFCSLEGYDAMKVGTSRNLDVMVPRPHILHHLSQLSASCMPACRHMDASRPAMATSEPGHCCLHASTKHCSGAMTPFQARPSRCSLHTSPAAIARACIQSWTATVQEADERAAEQALMMYRDKVRRWLSKMHGYECQASPLQAVGSIAPQPSSLPCSVPKAADHLGPPSFRPPPPSARQHICL